MRGLVASAVVVYASVAGAAACAQPAPAGEGAAARGGAGEKPGASAAKPAVPAATPTPSAAVSATREARAHDAHAAAPYAGADREAGARGGQDAGADGAAAESPKVKVVTIGMHVGGGPYDEITKQPIKRSVEPHFAELARCWKYVPKPRQADAGVDLLIEAGGGRAKVSNPRSTIEGEGFEPCVVAFFESIDFAKPRNGRTVVSYSVRFHPKDR
jgi:hypothetical protein